MAVLVEFDLDNVIYTIGKKNPVCATASIKLDGLCDKEIDILYDAKNNKKSIFLTSLPTPTMINNFDLFIKNKPMATPQEAWNAGYRVAYTIQKLKNE